MSNLMKDEDYQKMLLNHKKSAKKVNYKGNEFIVLGSYEIIVSVMGIL